MTVPQLAYDSAFLLTAIVYVVHGETINASTGLTANTIKKI